MAANKRLLPIGIQDFPDIRERGFVYGEFLNYWYTSGTPSFLVNLIEHKKINLKDVGCMMARLNYPAEYELEWMTPAVSLYQSGYLTISGYDDETHIYTLDFPNEEVHISFEESLIGHCR